MKRDSKGRYLKSGKGKGKGMKAGRAVRSIEARLAKVEAGQRALIGVVEGMETRLTNVEMAVSRIAGAMGDRFAKRKKGKKSKKAAAVAL